MIGARFAALLTAGLLAACAAVLPRPLPPSVEVQGIRALVMSSGETRFRVLLDVRNPNPYPLGVQSIEATLRLEDRSVATATLPQPVSLIASGPTSVEIEARADFSELRVALDRVLRKLAGHYELTGTAVVQDGTRLDFRREGDVPFASLLGRWQ